MSRINTPVAGAHEFYPVSEPEIGTPLTGGKPKLFKPIEIRGVTFKNRIFVSPMCQYSASDGHATDWHFVHYGSLATRGVGAICVEAAAVVPEGRITPEDAGLWKDSQIAPMKRIVDFAHIHGTKIGVQLFHAGRKASVYAPWVKNRAVNGSSVAQENENGWPAQVYGPSEIPFSHPYAQPKSLTLSDMNYIEDAFVAAVERCKQIGFDFIEVHAAHGYLLHQFLSPLSNTRSDEYGGTLENRLRFPTRLVESIRAAWGDLPLFVRISASDWKEGPEKSEDRNWLQWGIEQSNIWVARMSSLGVVDLLDCSSGGNWVDQQVPATGHGYQVVLAEGIKHANPSLVVGAVGGITDPILAESYLQTGKADVLFVGREFLRNPHWALVAAKQLGCQLKPANQYERAW
ncbi:NADH:flavin oxidoreductase/NADH oxidase [Mycena vulgaris]|nr:NADH:flavin oxidoreductase/NADH oxidase [Mycena vulgaris]